MAAAREAGDEAIIFMMKKFNESAVTEDDEFGSMLRNLFE
jgi:hypothetical protein